MVNIIENICRGIIFLVWGSTEVIGEVFYPFIITKVILGLIIIIVEFAVVWLWLIFFRNIYYLHKLIGKRSTSDEIRSQLKVADICFETTETIEVNENVDGPNQFSDDQTNSEQSKERMEGSEDSTMFIKKFKPSIWSSEPSLIKAGGPIAAAEKTNI